MDWKLLKNKNFSLFLFGNISSVFGDLFLEIGLALYVLQVTQSAGKFASILAIEVIPKLILGFFSGAVVDRLNKKKLMIFLDGIRGIFLVMIFLLLISGNLTIPIIYITVLFFGICDIFFGPCYITLLPSILKKDDLVKGNALNSTLVRTISIIAPIISTFLFGLFGLGFIIAFDALTFFISAISESLLKLEHKKTANKGVGNIINDIGDGFKISFKDIRVTSLVINGALTHLFLFPFLLLGTPYLLNTVIKVPPIYYGIVRGVEPVGMLLSALIVILLKKSFNTAQSINIGILGMLFSVILYIPIGFPSFVTLMTTNNIIALLYFAFVNFFIYLSFGFYGVFFVSYYQSMIPTDYLGRFGSMFITLISVSRFIGFKTYGYLFDKGTLMLSVFILISGMILKLLVHIPFIVKDKKTAKDSIGIQDN